MAHKIEIRCSGVFARAFEVEDYRLIHAGGYRVIYLTNGSAGGFEPEEFKKKEVHLASTDTVIITEIEEEEDFVIEEVTEEASDDDFVINILEESTESAET